MISFEIDYITTPGLYTIYVCNTSLDFCELIATDVPIPPIYSFELPEIFGNVQEVVIKVVEQQTNCEDFNYYQCFTPTPTISVTPTITPSKTVLCNCLYFENTGVTENLITFIQCDNTPFQLYLASGDTYYGCGSEANYGPNINFILGDKCINFTCPDLQPTPSVTPTLTPTLPQTVGYFESCCDSNFKFALTNIPFSGLSGVYAIRTNGFEGCATSIGYFSAETILTNFLIVSATTCDECAYRDPAAFICPTQTRTSTPTISITPSNTVTISLTPTITPTSGLAASSTPTPTPTLTTTPSVSISPTPTPTICCNCWSFQVNTGSVFLEWTNCDGTPGSNTFSFNPANPPKIIQVLNGTTPSASPSPAGTWDLNLIRNCTGCPGY